MKKANYFSLVLLGATLSLAACTTTTQQAAQESTPNVISLPFQAFGNEPGWSVEISPAQHAEVLLNYGERSFQLALPTPEHTYVGTHYRTTYNQQPLSLDIIYKNCSDTMSDTIFEYEAILRIEDQVLRGCGRPR